MKKSLRFDFKILFFIGLILLFYSVFVDWYYYDIYNDSGKLIASWNYNMIFSWTSALGSELNNLFKPNELDVSIIIVILYIACIICSGLAIMFKDVEKEEDLSSLMLFTYINYFLLILTAFFIFAFPAICLIGNDLYFPFMIFNDFQLSAEFHYSVGLGYLLNCAGFICVFPYAMFYSKTVAQFETKDNTAEKILNNYIEKNSDSVNIEQMISKERLIHKKIIEKEKVSDIKKIKERGALVHH